MNGFPESEEQVFRRVVQALEESEHRTRERRAARLAVTSKLQQVPPVLVGRFEQLHLLEEARVCFVYGQFAATVLVAYAVIEHTLDEEADLCVQKTSGMSKAANSIQLCREHQLVPSELLDRADALRSKRNAIGHFKPDVNKYRVTARARAVDASPYQVLETDAIEALGLAREIVISTLRAMEE